MFPFGDIMNNAVSKIYVHISHTNFHMIYGFNALGYIPRNVITGHMVTLCLTFEGLPNSFPKKLYDFTFTPVIYKILIFPHPPQ